MIIWTARILLVIFLLAIGFFVWAICTAKEEPVDDYSGYRPLS